MSDIGHNSGENPELIGIARRIVDDLDAIADAQERVKAEYAAAKSDGHDVKVLRQAIKELRGGPDYQAERLEAEVVLDTYRRGLGLPTSLEKAQAKTREVAAEIPAPKRRRQRDEAAS
ncbi:MAG: hypothetical protein RI936_27 [Pseudomonadota bacterium]|jgi:uncharacterized protein (UPF0335 family)